jgi:hypothetical protein
LIEEVSKGSPEPINFTESDTDPLIEIIYRFSKAAADGAARENLRLLAQVIAGLKRNKALEPDKFRKWANILEQLTRDELMVIGKALAVRRKMVAASVQPSVGPNAHLPCYLASVLGQAASVALNAVPLDGKMTGRSTSVSLRRSSKTDRMLS